MTAGWPAVIRTSVDAIGGWHLKPLD